MAEVVLLDAGPLVALADRGEALHPWASTQVHQMRGAMITCGAVLAEEGFVLRHHPTALVRTRDLLERGVIVSAEESQVLWLRAWALLERYANVPMSFADGCRVALSESLPAARVFTIDRDFLIYRQRDDKPLPLPAPFAR